MLSEFKSPKSMFNGATAPGGKTILSIQAQSFPELVASSAPGSSSHSSTVTLNKIF